MAGQTFDVPNISNEIREEIKNEFNRREFYEPTDPPSPMVKLTLENQHGRYSIELPGGMPSLPDLLSDMVIPLLLAAGFSSETIEDYIAVE